MAFSFKEPEEVKKQREKQAEDEANYRNFEILTPQSYNQSSDLQNIWNDISNWQTPTMDKNNNTWWNKLTNTMNDIENREKFSYDVNGDALYQQYKDQYTTQGKLAMMDTMGQAAAMTGGYGNSYAQSVGQQAYQGYLQQLTDKIPELYQLALNKYNSEGEELYPTNPSSVGISPSNTKVCRSPIVESFTIYRLSVSLSMTNAGCILLLPQELHAVNVNITADVAKNTIFFILLFF